MSDKVFLTEFIDLYRSFPCLWHTKSKDYTDRSKKHRAYELLTQKFRERHVDASRDTVTKKINSIRSVYRKERNKVKQSKSGQGAKEVYKPVLWYYNLLDFLYDQDVPKQSNNCMEDYECNSETLKDESNPDLDPLSSGATSPASIPASESPSFRSSRKRKNIDSFDDITTNAMPLVERRLTNFNPEDEYDVFGKHIANKLRAMNGQQHKFAQKLINDVIFEGDMESLSRMTKVTNTD